MGRRIAAFLAVALGGGIELFGALYGQGVLGHGALFGTLGDGTRAEAAVIGFGLGALTIVAGVGVMLAREPRWLAAAVVSLGVTGTLIAGPMFGYGALMAAVGALVAGLIDRTAPLY
ncbi:MAG: hypothetical protein L0227_08925 [Chloroflexi bacterium]|nr:hypothetical protein [Chloroflexota bacterium]